MNNVEVRSYWFYLEPYTFLFRGETCVIIYNSLSAYNCRIKNTPKILHVINKITKKKNLYVTEISEKELEDDSLKDFINKIRNSFSGDLVRKDFFSQKPVVFPPYLNLQMNVKNLQRDPELSLEQSLPDQLNELSFYITGHCLQSCENCDNYRKQFSFCHKAHKYLEYKDISKIIRQTTGLNISKVNILGGDIFSYKSWIELLELFNNYAFKKIFFTFLNNIDLIKSKQILIQQNTELRILINDKFDEIFFLKIIDDLREYELKLKWIFVVKNEFDLSNYNSLILKYNLKQYHIIPFLCNENLYFFKNNVFSDIEDVLNLKVSKKEIFAHQTLNQIDYGKLIFTENGEVYANLNHLPIGKIEDDLFYLILKEFKEGKSWRKTRAKLSQCKKCVYKFLCPSPSGYDYFLKNKSVCNLSNNEKGLNKITEPMI